MTRTEELYEVLRSELLNGVLTPGQKLRMVELGSRFHVSQSVVREALTRLSGQGLIVSTPQRGFRVRELCVQDITDLTETRLEIETLAVRLAIERGDMAWETGVLAAHHVLERTPVTQADGETVNEEWPSRHRDLHRALIAGCGNARLEGVALALRDSAELYRRWYWALTDDDDRDLGAEHEQLKQAALARDAVAAVELLAEHIECPPRQLIAYAREQRVDKVEQPSDRSE